jgi:hypothetical protein
MKKSKKVIYTFSKTDRVQLQNLPWNRNTSLRSDLINSMNKHGFIGTIDVIKTDIIDGNINFYTADGNHRKMAAFELNIPVEAIIHENKFNSVNELVEFIAMLNNTQKPWTVANFVHSYATLQKESYVTLQRFANKYKNFSLSTLAALLHGIRSYKTPGSMTKVLKEGTFKINHLETTKKVLEYAAKLSKYQAFTSRMILALNYIYNRTDFVEEMFTENFKYKAKTIKELKLDDYTDIFTSWMK